jgi:L-ribulose-5-phosphate 4-epimerase
MDMDPSPGAPPVAKAVENALAFEIIAEMTVKALQINPAASPISQTLLDKHLLRKHGPGAYYRQSGSGLLKSIHIVK